MPSPATEDYLKAIFKLSQESQAATTSSIAAQLGIAAGSVSGMLRRLSERGLVEHVPYYGARLTADGEEEALRTIRRHRIIELFLVEVLGYDWDRVHDEAERLEHAASDDLIGRMAHVLGEPTADPHGAPIPSVEGTLVDRAWPRLEELDAGQTGTVRRVSDEDPAALRYLGELGLRPGTSVRVLEHAPFNGPLVLSVAGQERSIGRELARTIRVEPLDSPTDHDEHAA